MLDVGEKIKSFQKIAKLIDPYRATIIGGSFYPFNDYYFRLLKWAAAQSRPLTLIVIVHTDKIVSLRRGFIPLLENQRQRAKRIAALPFVDYVVISSRVAHDPFCLKLLKPKFVVFQRDNRKYQEKLLKELKLNFPAVQAKTVPFKRNVNQIPHAHAAHLPYLKTKDKIVRILVVMSTKSKASIGKISAVLAKKDKIVAKAVNSDKEEHAETILLKNFKPKTDLSDYALYVLIPPCLVCAKTIISRNLKNVYYLFKYGDGFAMKYLRFKGVKVKQYRN